MTNTQFYLAIGIPMLFGIFNLGVIVTLLLHFSNKLDARIDKLDAKIDGIHDKLDAKIDGVRDGLRLELGAKIDGVRDGLRLELGAKIDRLGEDYTRFYGEQRKQQEAIDILKQKVLGT